MVLTKMSQKVILVEEGWNWRENGIISIVTRIVDHDASLMSVTEQKICRSKGVVGFLGNLLCEGLGIKKRNSE